MKKATYLESESLFSMPFRQWIKDMQNVLDSQDLSHLSVDELFEVAAMRFGPIDRTEVEGLSHLTLDDLLDLIPTEFDLQAPHPTQSLINYYVAHYDDIIPTAAEAKEMLAYLEQSELPFYRKMLGEVQFSRSAAMDWIYRNHKLSA